MCLFLFAVSMRR